MEILCLNVRSRALFSWFFDSWADSTRVKILYKAYPSFHNTAKSKKGAGGGEGWHSVLQGSLISFTSNLFLKVKNN